MQVNHHTIKINSTEFRTQFSFSLDERQARVSFGTAGIAYKMPETKEEHSMLSESFGWSANPNIYMPEVTAANIMPKPEDFVNVPFRLLSATIVAGGTWRATDFSEGNVLKSSVSKLSDKAVFLEHDTNLENIVGMVRAPKWSNGYKDIPAGIDGIISIDSKTNPKIARGVMMGGIYSNSVTVLFDWKPSHEFDNESEFENQVGKKGADGKMVRRIVTKVHDYYESSLVFLGADPYAKLIDEEGNLVHPDYAHAFKLSLNEEQEEVKKEYNEEKKYIISSGLTKELLSLSSSKFSFDKKITPMNPEIIAKLKKVLGLSETEEITEAHIETLSVVETSEDDLKEIETNKEVASNAISLMKSVDSEANDFAEFSKAHTFAKKEDVENLSSLKLENDSLKSDKVELSKKAALLEDENVEAKKLTDGFRAEVEKNYRIQSGNNVNEGVLSLIGKANAKELDALSIQYGGSAFVRFGAKCKKCNSTEFTFQSSVPDEDNSGEARKSTSFEEIKEKFKK